MPKRLLLINPNTTASITDRLVAAAQSMAPDVQFVGVTGRFGARYISSRATYAIASHAALDAWANAEGHFDAVILACFGDPGLVALRELSVKPVVGMAEASLHAAVQLAGRFSIVTGGLKWQAMLRELTVAQGVEQRVASIRTVSLSGGAIASAPDRAVPLLHEACRQCVEEDGAEAVILGGAGLVNLSPVLRPQFNIPVIDALESAVTMALALATLMPRTRASNAPREEVECIGLSDALTDALGYPLRVA